MMFNRTMHGTQRGVATILIVLLIALSLTAAVLLGVQYNRSLQEQSISLHAQTAAQSKAWETAEIVRQYFDELQKDAGFDTLFTNIENELAVNNNGLALTLLGEPDELKGTTATLQNAWKDNGIPNFGVLIESTAAKDTRAEAKARLEVVISYVGGVKKDGSPTIGHFLGDTSLSGSIKILVDKGQLYNISVDGNLTVGSASIHGDEEGFTKLNSIYSTKSIKLESTSNTVFSELHANCDIMVGGGAAAKYVYARNNICLSNAQKSEKNEEIKANGSVHIAGGKDWGDVMALAGADDILAGVDDEEMEPCLGTAVKYCEGIVPADKQGIFFVSPTDNKGVRSHQTTEYGVVMSLKGKGKDTTYNSAPRELEPVPLVTVEKATLDVESLKDYANYYFEYRNNRIEVEVKNVNGIDSETYTLNTTGENKNKLCRPLNTDDCYGPITNGSIGYANGANGLWTINGSIAPGFVIFKGNLQLGEGNYINTIGATGSIVTNSNAKVYSLNYSGYNGKRGAAEFAPNGVCYNMVVGGELYPDNLCDLTEPKDEDKYDYNKIGDYGNYGLLATENISLKSNTTVFGAIKAGSALTAESNTTAHGYVSGLGGDVQHTLKGFSIDLTNLPEGYELIDSNVEQGGEGGNTEAHAVILWSRYK